MVLTEHIAVMDLMVLADALLLLDDDLALATVLKSPLFGLDDEALFDLAWKRPKRLYDALKQKRPELAARLEVMRHAARTHAPFAFYAWLLGAEGGRRSMYARLGHEAADALDEFLNLALDYERTETPSLQGFIAWLRAAKAEVKRDMEMDRDEVRVMTVHGAKGLEAPVVVLADTTTPAQGWHPPRLLSVTPERAPPGAGARIVWGTSKDFDVGPMVAAREAALQAAREEYRRLLYVAMTRAAERLIVCGTKGEHDIPKDCWYRLVTDALQEHCVPEPADHGAGEVMRFRKGKAEPQQASDAPPPPESPALPGWLTRAVEQEAPVATVTPSSSAAHVPVRTADTRHALLRGSLTHRLMQALPEIAKERRADAAQDYLARAGAELDAGERARIAEQALRIAEHPDFSALYGPNSRAEVPIVGRLTLGGKEVRVSGQIDRLSVSEKAVLIADFKTDRNSPARVDEAPDSYVRQLALYRAVLARLYPDRAVRAALVFTETPVLMEIPPARLDAALQAPLTLA
jgi:ATP-dependent helicase/nuclease subunit A